MNTSHPALYPASAARQLLTLLAVAAAGVLITLLMSFTLLRQEREHLAMILDQRAIEHTDAIQKTIDINLSIVESIGSFFYSAKSVTRDEFHDISQRALDRHRTIQALEWIPLVPQAEREAYEQAARKEGLAGFAISERGQQGQMVAAAQRAEYFPVYYVEPRKGNEAAMGFDLASDPVRLAALNRACDSGETTLTGRITLVQESGGQYGFLSFVPIYRRGMPRDGAAQRRPALQGFVLGVYRAGDLLETALKNIPAAGLDAVLYDESAAPEQRLLYFHPSRTRNGRVALAELEAQARTGLHKRIELSGPGYHWSLLFTPAPAFYAAQSMSRSWLALITGLIFTALLDAYLWREQRRRAQLETLTGQLREERAQTNEKAEQLAESESRFRNLVETNNDWVWEVDENAAYTYVGPQVHAMLGYRPEELLGKTPFERMSAEEAQRVAALFGAHIAAREPLVNLENVNLHKDGHRVVLETSGTPTIDQNGKFRGYRGIDRDISERKRAEEALKKSEARYRSYIEVTGQLAWVTGADGAVVEDIPTWRAFTGLSAEQVKGWGWTEALHPDDRERAAQMWREAVARKGVYELEYRVRRRDGIYRDFFARGVPVLDASGSVREWVGTSIDITDFKWAEAALRENQVRLDLALRSARMGVWHLDIIENRRYFDDQVCRLLGIDPTTFAGTAEEFFGAVHPDDRETIKASLARTMEQDVPYELEFRAVWPNGSVRYIMSRGRLVRDDKGRPARINGIAWDITDRKQSEEGLKLFRALIDQSTDAIEVLDPETFRFLDVNQKACLELGYSRDELLSLSAFDIDPVLDQSKITEMRQELRKLGFMIIDGRHRRKDGAEFPVEVSLGYVQLDRAYIISVARDITKRKQDELALIKANHALRTISACNGALVRAGNESELLDSICRLIVEVGGYRMAWVGVPEQNPVETVRPVAQYGHDEGKLEAVKISWADSVRGHGPTGTAIRTGTVQINQNLLTDPALTLWREVALPRGYHSSIALPLKSSMGTLGVLTIYASEPDAFNEAEVKLLQELAGDLAFGIETLRTRAERDRIAYEQLHHTEILRQSLEDSIKVIADTVEMRDPYTAGHQRRVAQLAVAIARELGLPEETSRGIELAASIHDLGKISVPAEILAKPSKLTEIELMLLKTHAQTGFDILKDIKFPWPIATMVLQHHERLDGSGYPQGLKGEQILLESRIMAVADVVEAMASHRPYRAALGIDLALQEIKQGRGTVYDAAVVDACIRLFAEKRFAFSI